MTLYQQTTHDTLVRPGLLFLNWSTIYCRLPGLLPSYIKTDNSAYLPNRVFLALFLLLILLALSRCALRRVRSAPVIVFFVIFSFSSLFPRPDLGAPQKMTDSRGYPALIYFSPPPAVQIDGQAWIFSGPAMTGILIESLRPFKSIGLELQNRLPGDTVRLAVAAFDQGPVRRQLPAAAALEIKLLQPPYKKIKNHYFYQLTMQGTTASGAAVPSWRLRIDAR
jgi:hypothetical protein